jgi:hypothetical protein
MDTITLTLTVEQWNTIYTALLEESIRTSLTGTQATRERISSALAAVRDSLC